MSLQIIASFLFNFSLLYASYHILQCSPFSVLILLVGWLEEHLASKKLGVVMLVMISSRLELCMSLANPGPAEKCQFKQSEISYAHLLYFFQKKYVHIFNVFYFIIHMH